MSKKTGNIVQKVVTLNTFCDVACLTFPMPVVFRDTDDNPQLAPSEPPTFERTQQTCSQMRHFCISQVSMVTFSDGVGKWITVCFFLRSEVT